MTIGLAQFVAQDSTLFISPGGQKLNGMADSCPASFVYMLNLASWTLQSLARRTLMYMVIVWNKEVHRLTDVTCASSAQSERPKSRSSLNLASSTLVSWKGCPSVIASCASLVGLYGDRPCQSDFGEARYPLQQRKPQAAVYLHHAGAQSSLPAWPPMVLPV